MKDQGSILVEHGRPAGLTGPNRPDSWNALNAAAMHEDVDAETALDADPGVAGVVVSDFGVTFADGADTEEMGSGGYIDMYNADRPRVGRISPNYDLDVVGYLLTVVPQLIAAMEAKGS